MGGWEDNSLGCFLCKMLQYCPLKAFFEEEFWRDLTVAFVGQRPWTTKGNEEIEERQKNTRN